MDNTQNYHPPAKVADVDNYNNQAQQYAYYPNEGSSSPSSQPSAPPQSEVYTPLIQHSPQHYYNVPQQQQQYQTIQMPIPHNYTQVEPHYRYIIKKRGTDGRQFPIQASIFLLGCLAPPVWLIACCWPSNNGYEIAWRKVNYWMIGLFFVGVIFFAVIFTMIILEDGHFPDPDPDWRIPQFFSYLFSLFGY